MNYTWGIKSKSGDQVYAYNMTEHEARRIALADKQFVATMISTRNCPLRDGHDRAAQHAKDLARC
jgi:hypothetical protein